MADRAPSSQAVGTASQRLAFLFPGQGSQQVGMGRGLLDASAAARQVFARADARLGWALSELCLRGPEPELTRTENLQPALFTVSMAAHAALQEQTPIAPQFAMGHSLGEYAALVAGGALEFEDALGVVRRRGEWMASAVPEGTGGMAAVVGLEFAPVEEVCRQAAGDDVLAVANLNCPGQVVVSGHLRALERAEPLLRQAGAKGLIRLKVSVPFHCELMRPAAERLAEALAGISVRPPRLTVLSNATGQAHTDPATIRHLLVEQLTRPVRWTECVRFALERGVDRFLEIGPGNVLAGLLKRIDRRARVLGVGDPQAVNGAGAFVGQESVA